MAELTGPFTLDDIACGGFTTKGLDALSLSFDDPRWTSPGAIWSREGDAPAPVTVTASLGGTLVRAGAGTAPVAVAATIDGTLVRAGAGTSAVTV
ncbi:MAG: hypothetical protein K2Q10_03740, partial [Rhodospirillales bacterium]|nr:hypothetical protein [Rhodospirillales bacterium]